MTQSIMDTIQKRIHDADEGTIFMTSSFSDLASSTTARQCLGRLVSAKTIRRVLEGVYEKPKYSSYLKGNVPTNPELVARAIADNYHWTIAPSGEIALNKLGLSTQVPVVWTYISDGPYREYTFDGVTISYKHRTNRNISKMSEVTIILIEALKSLGKERVDEKTIQILKKRFSDDDKKTILKEGMNSPEWIYEVIRKVCEEA